MARDSEVGNSQSDVNDTTQKRVSAPLNALATDAVTVGGEIEIIHRAGQVEIRVGVEALDERAALMAQIGLHLEVRVERERRIFAVLKLAAELAMQRGVREIRDVRAHARDREPAPRIGALDRNSGRCRHSGSAITAWRPTSWKAMFCAEWRVAQAIGSARTRAWDSSPPIAAPACRPSSRPPPRTASRCQARRAAWPGRAPCRGW